LPRLGQVGVSALPITHIAIDNGGQGVVSIKNSVIAENSVAGVQANGASAGVMIGTTLLDQNATGATSAVCGAMT
jgi:hypothetical protein